MSADQDTEVNAAVQEILLQVARCATPRAKLDAMKAGVQRVPAGIRGAVELLVLSMEAIMEAQNNAQTTARRDRIGLAAAGAAFLLVLLVIALAVPNPTRFQERVFVVVLALAAGAFGGFLPGALQVQGGHKPHVWVRATGAIGFAAFVLLFYRFIL